MTTYLLFKGPCSSTLCGPENWAQATWTEKAKDAEHYLMSFECKTPEEALDLKQVYNTTPELFSMSHSELILEVKKLQDGIRKHRDSAGHDLCWYVPELWSLLPEGSKGLPEVPPTEEFLKCCEVYRKSLDPDVKSSEDRTE